LSYGSYSQKINLYTYSIGTQDVMTFHPPLGVHLATNIFIITATLQETFKNTLKLPPHRRGHRVLRLTRVELGQPKMSLHSVGRPLTLAFGPLPSNTTGCAATWATQHNTVTAHTVMLFAQPRWAMCLEFACRREVILAHLHQQPHCRLRPTILTGHGGVGLPRPRLLSEHFVDR
jgi:hypothetical protein